MSNTTTLAAEDFQPGYRYWPVRPGHEQAWTVATVETYTTGTEVFRDGRWTALEMVRITYRDGRARDLERGEQVAIQGPWHTDADGDPVARACEGCLAAPGEECSPGCLALDE
ncbi:hypothetical protein ACUXZZ_45335 (plasmid) [Streptomyces graminifolii]|uniref:hypothetical protein n=1 Tax=Streptomyces graminifolii TaxID=1266771 RepID=UPI00405A3BC9